MHTLVSGERIDRLIYGFLLLLGFSSCLSEPFSRNAARLLLVLFLFRILMGPQVLGELQRYKSFFLAMLGLVFVLLFSAFHGGQFYDNVTGSTFWYNYNMLLFFLVCGCIQRREQLENILLAMFVSLFFVDLYIYWQGWHGQRPVGLIPGTFMLTAMFYVLSLPVLAVLSVHENFRQRAVLYRSLLVLGILALFFTQTRGAWLPAAVVVLGVLFYYVRQKKKLFAALGGIAAVLAVIMFLSPQMMHRVTSVGAVHTDQAQSERFLMWQSALAMAKDHPFLGVGMGNYAEQYQQHYISPQAKEPQQRHAHSNYMQFLAEDGILGLSVYCAVFGYFLFWSWRRRRSAFAMMMFAATLSLMLYSITDYTFAGYAGMRFYWLLLGICAKGVQLRSNDWEVMF